MKTLFYNGTIVNVFTGTIEHLNVLIEDNKILGIGNYTRDEADEAVDVSGKILCPAFIDGHIHIESTMLNPIEMAKVCVPHGTGAIIADPHEIANVSGRSGLSYMLQASQDLPMMVFFMMPSCVPATNLDKSGATLSARDILPYYQNARVLGLAEMMNYPGVLAGDSEVKIKLEDALEAGKIVNGHAPMLTGKALDRYISAGIGDDHECTSADEAKERIRKGQRVMIRQGTAARNLTALLPLFEEPWCHRCMLVTDDKHPADLMRNGHIDSIIREAVQNGKSAIRAIQMATIQCAEYYGLKRMGAIAPGYTANFLVLENLNSVRVERVYHNGRLVARNGEIVPFERPWVDDDVYKTIRNSFFLKHLKAEDFYVEPVQGDCRVIRLIPRELLTVEEHTQLYWNGTNGIDIDRDILKIAVLDRHMKTGQKGIGFLTGTGIKAGAIASSVSHDSHNLIVIGTNEADMALAANHVVEIDGGMAVVRDGKVLADLPLPLAGLMSKEPAETVARQNTLLRDAAASLGGAEGIEPFMNMAFASLTVIPHIKLTAKGLVDVDRQCIVPLKV